MLGRTYAQARDVARVCVRCALALRCKRSLHKETIFSAFPVAPMYEMRFSRNLLQLIHVQHNSCPTVTLAGAPDPVYALLHTCWSLDEVLARHLNARIQVFSCLRSVGHRCCDGVKSSREHTVTAAPSSWLVGLSTTWARAQHVCNNRGPHVTWYLSSRVCCTP